MSQIEWTDQTWNPIAGCSVVSPGCTNCYAMRIAGDRLKTHPKYAGLTQPSKAGPVWTGETRFDADALTIPLKRRKPTRYFVNSMSDLFHEGVSDEVIDLIFAVMALSPQHQFQVLTKRAERMQEYVAGARDTEDDPICERIARAGSKMMEDGDRWWDYLTTEMQWPLPNVWLGVSVEDQARADERMPILHHTPAAVRFISAEPLLGPVDLNRGGWSLLRPLKPPPRIGFMKGRIHWVIVGGESGPGRRDMDPAWARSIRDQCAVEGVPFFMKQMTGKRQIPDDLMIRQWPKAEAPPSPSLPVQTDMEEFTGAAE